MGRSHHDDDVYDDDDGYLLAVELRKTPDPPEPQLKPTKDSDRTSCSAVRLQASNFNLDLDSINANQGTEPDVGTRSDQQRKVTHMIQRFETSRCGSKPCRHHILVYSVRLNWFLD